MSDISPFEGKILQAQLLLREAFLDGWLLCSYKDQNAFLAQLLSPEFRLQTEFPVFLWIPSHGPGVFCLHERDQACHSLPGEVRTYHSWKERAKLLAKLLEQAVRIASEFSFKSFVPEISFLDAGTYTLIKSFGVDLVSSEDLVSELFLTWDQEELNRHLFAASVLEQLCSHLPRKIRESLCSEQLLDELSLKNYILAVLESSDCFTEIPPKVLVNERSARPWALTIESNAISWGDYVLVDLACRKNEEGAPYATLSRCFFLGDSPDAFLYDTFFLARRAQQAALHFMEERRRDAHSFLGWEVDRIARDFIHLAGLESSFRCPLGHSLGKHSYRVGPSLDDLYVHDTRMIVPRTCFCLGPFLSVEGRFGIDVKTSVYFSSDGTFFLTTGEQAELYTFTESREARIPMQSSKIVSY
ncbi:M24 family metallopeptidase [Candidatus Similichlamydia laticola]|uniref:Aminopeptidase YpdF (MP-, MA-, MS-, AP-, NP-specific) n=1 Tax=Candidatus Similichlamydia laticola TaxID=2170265 RepID=A0A369KD85_9BACT|nr:M24 family metallopeptidase [Candidatus Similichlamydia laticola]RDB31420.1 Aminopeptidase YpdF (MP-, MA-, MS-, AP-, NP- specific) [Candidatus Similichlamydia laticola]